MISNIDDDLFAETRKLLDVEFDAVITAEQARSYKPSSRNFEMAMERFAFLANDCCTQGRAFITMSFPLNRSGCRRYG